MITNIFLSPPQVQYSLLPTVQLRPRRVGPGEEETEHPGYRCPVYVTQVSRARAARVRRSILPRVTNAACPRVQGRYGETNTTGNSSNFIFYIYLPSSREPDHWTNRGVAATCQIDT